MTTSLCPTCGGVTHLLPNTERPLGAISSYMKWQCESDAAHVFDDENSPSLSQSRSFGDH
ncbi:hypothetical protein [Naasia sp.]|uniref:hypothetical protein n=1 Tax=Naasia sp. TaxID=2546198 RepID=UPI00263A0DAA|nr:hypothetical protein [Naasia sp.]